MKKYKIFILIGLLSFVVCFSLLISMPVAQGETSMRLTSSVFEHNQMIPKKYTCQGEDINPPLKIENIPEGTETLALIVDDPDAPVGTWVHWVVFNIQPTDEIKENSVPGDQAYNDFKKINYGGPCPPTGTHRYFFKLYALDIVIDLQTGMKKQDLEKAMKGHILAEIELIGLYKEG